MEKLLFSRKQKEETTERIGNISPEKYGKGAYCDLTYTPSKLADNVLFREASNLKKIEEQTSKNRSLQAENEIIKDQVSYLKKQKEGIEGSLNDIIKMYKAIIADMQAKNEERIKDSQKKWNEEIQKFIHDKQEEARYFQSEKQILEERIEQLECNIQALNDEIQERKNTHADFERQVEGLQNDKKRLEQKQAALEKKAIQDSQKAKTEYDSLKKQFMHAEVAWKNNLNEEIRKKQKEIQTNQRSHRAEIEKLETNRKSEMMLKNQQINEIARTFQTQINRLKEILVVKDRMIQNLSIENNKQKNRILNLTRDYQTQISHLTHEKNRLIDQLDNLGRDNQYLAKDKVILAGDLERQNNNLRQLLMESSVELERCKNQFLTLAKQNSILIGKLKSAEEQAKTWRDSYYMNKARPY